MGERTSHGQPGPGTPAPAPSSNKDPECQEALETLYNFLDGELTDDRRRDIQHHLDECSPCLEAFDFEAELKEVIARRCKETVPDALRVRIEIALQHASISFDSPEEGAHTHPQTEHQW
jgi:mycothiol system anti-sigma-R factor